MSEILRKIFPLIMLLPFLTGCGNKISPLSPEFRQDLQNQNGQIEDIKNNQNGIMAEMLKLRQQTEINSRDIKSFQQGVFNWNIEGDGPLILIFALITIAMLLIYHYRVKAIKQEKAAKILAQQIALHDDQELRDKVFLAALNTEVEKDVYHLLKKSK